MGPFVDGGPMFFRDHLSMGTELVGDRLSRRTNQLGTNFGGPSAFGTKYVTAKQTHTLIKKAKKWYQVGQIFTLEKVQGQYFQRNK